VLQLTTLTAPVELVGEEVLGARRGWGGRGGGGFEGGPRDS